MRVVLARLSGLALALCVFELIIQQVYSFSSVWEPDYGVINAPGRVIRWRREGHAVSHWTEHGLRGARPKDPSVRPVLVVGDSFTEAVQVDDEEAYPEVAEQTLRAGGTDIELWNAGRSSASVADYVVFARRHRRLFSPRWFVVELRDEDLAEDAWVTTKSHFTLTDSGTVSVERVLPPARGRIGTALWNWRQRDMLVGYAFVRFGDLARAAEDEPPLFRAGAASTNDAPAARDYPIEAELELLFDTYDGQVTVLHLANFDPRALGERTRTEARLLEYCARRRRSCVTTRGGYPGLWARGAAPYGHSNSEWNSGHMNADGHRLAADVLATELARLASDGLL